MAKAIQPALAQAIAGFLLCNTPPIAAGALALGYPKGSSATLPFGRLPGIRSAGEIFGSSAEFVGQWRDDLVMIV